VAMLQAACPDSLDTKRSSALRPERPAKQVRRDRDPYDHSFDRLTDLFPFLVGPKQHSRRCARSVEKYFGIEV
jgi:hypothetical protein